MANGNVEPGTEPGTVPNGSEPPSSVPDSDNWARATASTIPVSKRNRAHSVTDEELKRVAEVLTDRLERLPTASELIDAAGGCQKQRALQLVQLNTEPLDLVTHRASAGL